MTEKIYTIAVLKAKPGKAEALISALEELAAETRNEDGAEEYGFIRDQKNPETVLSYERWTSIEAEAAHWKTPHLNKALEQLRGILDGAPTIYKGHKVI